MNGCNEASVSHETRMCPCGTEECRPGQRNGHACHAKANAVYRARKAARDERIALELSELKLKIIARGAANAA